MRILLIILGIGLCLLSIGAFASGDTIAGVFVLLGGLALVFFQLRKKADKIKDMMKKPVLKMPEPAKKKNPPVEKKQKQSVAKNEGKDRSSEIVIEIDMNDVLASIYKEDDSVIDVTGKQEKLGHSWERRTGATVQPGGYQNGEADPMDVRLGTKYKEKLNLDKKEVNWLNQFWDQHNVFLAIEGCCIATIKLYLACLHDLDRNLSSLDKAITQLTEELAAEAETHDSSSWSYISPDRYRANIGPAVFLTLFKRAENGMREAFGHNRQIDDYFQYRSSVSERFEERFGQPMAKLMTEHLAILGKPDAQTELELNRQNVLRWKPVFNKITKRLDEDNIKEAVAALRQLGEVNKLNPSVENIYFEASKAVAKLDRLEAIRFYLQYLHADLLSDRVDNKQHNKSIQKSLFTNEDEIEAFTKLANELIKDRDIEKALRNAPNIFAKKRKTIGLDQDLIGRAKAEHAQTVDILNDVLAEDADTPHAPLEIKNSDTGETTFVIEVVDAPELPAGPFLADAGLTGDQEQLLLLFEEKELSLDRDQLDAFAKQRNAFGGQLIDRINESCYDLLDDVLIEESDNRFTIQKDYFDKIRKP